MGNFVPVQRTTHSSRISHEADQVTRALEQANSNITYDTRRINADATTIALNILTMYCGGEACTNHARVFDDDACSLHGKSTEGCALGCSGSNCDEDECAAASTKTDCTGNCHWGSVSRDGGAPVEKCVRAPQIACFSNTKCKDPTGDPQGNCEVYTACSSENTAKGDYCREYWDAHIATNDQRQARLISPGEFESMVTEACNDLCLDGERSGFESRCQPLVEDDNKPNYCSGDYPNYASHNSACPCNLPKIEHYNISGGDQSKCVVSNVDQKVAQSTTIATKSHIDLSGVRDSLREVAASTTFGFDDEKRDGVSTVVHALANSLEVVREDIESKCGTMLRTVDDITQNCQSVTERCIVDNIKQSIDQEESAQCKPNVSMDSTMLQRIAAQADSYIGHMREPTTAAIASNAFLWIVIVVCALIVAIRRDFQTAGWALLACGIAFVAVGLLARSMFDTSDVMLAYAVDSIPPEEQQQPRMRKSIDLRTAVDECREQQWCEGFAFRTLNNLDSKSCAAPTCPRDACKDPAQCEGCCEDGCVYASEAHACLSCSKARGEATFYDTKYAVPLQPPATDDRPVAVDLCMERVPYWAYSKRRGETFSTKFMIGGGISAAAGALLGMSAMWMRK